MLQALLQDQADQNLELNEVPQCFSSPTPGTLYSIFLLSNALQGEMLRTNQQIFNYLVFGYLGL